MFKRNHQAGRNNFIAIIALLLCAATASAQTIELEPFVIDVGQQWTTLSRDRDTVSLTVVTADHQPELTFVTRKREPGSPERNPAQILRQWHQANLAPSDTGEPAIRSGRLDNGIAAWLLEPAVGLDTPPGDGPVRVSLALDHHEHLLLVSLTTDAASAKQWQLDLGSMLHSIEGGTWPSRDRKLSGFYATIGSTVSLSLLARTRHLLGINGLLLSEDGRFALTETGMGSALSQVCEQQPTACGRYQATETGFSSWRSTSTVESNLNFLREDERTLHSEADGTLIIGGARYQPIKANAQKTLDGRFRSASTSQMEGPDGERLNAYRETLFTFYPDGRFEQNELNALTRASTGTPLSLSSGAAPRQGSYRISDFALELDFENTDPVRYPMFMLQGVPVIGGSMYKQLKSDK